MSDLRSRLSVREMRVTRADRGRPPGPGTWWSTAART